MSEPSTFMQLALHGDVMPDEIDDFIERWHNTESELNVHDYLGMTNEEYSLWVSEPDYIDLIIAARLKRRPLREAVNDNLRSQERIAARSGDASKIAILKRWIAAQPDR